jgi:hypothetical protein
MSVYVIRAFIELREQVATNAAILKRLAEIDQNASSPRFRPPRRLQEIAAAVSTSDSIAQETHRLPFVRSLSSSLNLVSARIRYCFSLQLFSFQHFTC